MQLRYGSQRALAHKDWENVCLPDPSRSSFGDGEITLFYSAGYKMSGRYFRNLEATFAVRREYLSENAMQDRGLI